MAAIEENPFENLIKNITKMTEPPSLTNKRYQQSARTFVYKDEDQDQDFIKSHLKNNISTDSEIDLHFIIQKYNNGDYDLNSERQITRKHVDDYLKKYNYNNAPKRVSGNAGGKPKPNKRKKTKRRKSKARKTNKRRKTKSKRKKRTRRRR
jgi:hypothetical protein